MATDEGDEEGRRRPFGSRLPKAPGPRFRDTKLFLLALAAWATAGAVLTPVVMALDDAGLDDIASWDYLPCTASYMVVAALLMWALALSFMREA